MRFSMRVAPGLRLSTSGHGIRAGIGPRVARVHVGTGRPGVSTGAGPLSLYSSIGGPGRRTGATATTSTTQRLNAAEKAQQAHELGTVLDSIGTVHRQTFEPVQRPLAPEPVLPGFPKILRAAEKNELASTRITARSARRQAKQHARNVAERHAMKLLTEAEGLKSGYQTQLDLAWQKLLDNDTDTVLEVLDEAFQDNDAPAAAVGVDGSDVSVVVLAPPSQAIPERYPTTTAAGNLSIKKMTKSMRSDYYKLLVCGHVVVTALETFAVAPGAKSTTLVVVRRREDGAVNGNDVEPILATKILRSSLGRLSLSTMDAAEVINQVGLNTLTKTKGTAKELQPIDLHSEPDLQDLLARMGPEDLDE